MEVDRLLKICILSNTLHNSNKISGAGERCPVLQSAVAGVMLPKAFISLGLPFVWRENWSSQSLRTVSSEGAALSKYSCAARA